jgi:hypothetical protein
MATTIVNKYHKLPFDEYIGRGSKWGNPFSHMEGTKAKFKVATREEAIQNYRQWILRQPELLLSLHELKDKTLACFCKPAACHGDVIVDLIENTFFLVIAGSRDFDDYELLKMKADKITRRIKKQIVVVSGTAKGADRLGERYAKERGYDVAYFPADWNRYGKRAGMLRNCDMATLVKNLRGGVICFWDGSSPGTRGMINICEELGVQLRVIKYPNYA